MSHDASGRTNTKREIKLFLVFLKISVTRCGRPNRHNKTKENIFRFLDFSIFFVIFYNLKYFHFIFFRKRKKINNKKDKSKRNNNSRVHE